MYDPSQLYVDPILSGFAVGYRPQNLYGVNFFPITRVNTQSGRYRVFDRSDWLIFPDRREPGTVANEVRGRKWSTDNFATREHSLQAPVYDEERQELNSLGGLANPAFGGMLDINPEQDAVKLIVRSLSLGHEKKVADTMRNTANYPGSNTVTLVGAAQWNDYTGGVASTSDPVTVIQTAIRVISAKIGRPPNLMAIPTLGIPYIEQHPRVVARFQYLALTLPDAFQRLTGFNGNIIQVDSSYNTADNIDAAESITIGNLWGQDVWIGYIDETEGMDVQTFAKTFSQIYPTGDIRPTDRWREEPRKADLFRTSWKYDLKIVSSICGYLIKNAFAATAW